RAREIGARIERWALALQAEQPSIGDVRVSGAMAALEFVEQGDPERPDAELTRELVAAGAEAGLILLSCGVRGNVIRLLPPLIIGDALLEEALDTLAQVIASVAGRLRKAG
ncbi:MAG: aminotransferase class III-fold pyridoxal phosphate-dependent enzyme, partial [Gammaproteobacteria bacterium]